MNRYIDAKKGVRFTTAPVLISLALLLLNDFYLKATYGNWLTGKLSDFAGIFLVAVLGCILFPQRKGIVSVAVVAFFVYWKSSFSEPFIATLNAWGAPGFRRVVDYTDLVALSMVAFAWFVASRGEGTLLRRTTLRRILVMPVVFLCLFSMVATSRISYDLQLEVEQASSMEVPDRRAIADALATVGKAYRFKRDRGDVAELSGRWAGNKSAFSYVILDDGAVSIWISSYKERVPDKLFKALEEALDELAGDVKFKETTFGLRNTLHVKRYGMEGRGSPHGERIATVIEVFEETIEAPQSEIDQTETGPTPKTNWNSNYSFWDENSLLVEFSGFDQGVRQQAGETLTRMLLEAMPGAEIYPLKEHYGQITVFVDLRNVDPPN